MNELWPRRRRVDDGNGMIPMINIVFLLLIFFLVAGQVSAIRGEGLDLPEGHTTSKPRSGALQLAIDREGGLRLDGQPIPLEALAPRLAEQQANADTTPASAVHLLVDRDLSAARLGPVLEVLRGHQAESVRLILRDQDAAR